MPSFRPQIVDRGASSTVAPPQATPAPFTPPTPSGSPTDLVPQTFDPAPVTPATPGVLPSGGGINPVITSAGATDFATLNQQSLQSALAAIEAQFGLTREQLLADRSAIGQEYQLLNAQAERARGQALDQVGFNAQERGITRSGIFAEDVADTELQFAELLAQQEAGLTSSQEAIDQQLAAQVQQEEIARLQAEQEAQLRALDNEVMQLLLDAGL